MNISIIAFLHSILLVSHVYALEKPDVCLEGSFYVHEDDEVMVPSTQASIQNEEWVSLSEAKPNIYFISSEDTDTRPPEERAETSDHKVFIRKEKKSSVTEPVKRPYAIFLKNKLFVSMKNTVGLPISGKDSCKLTKGLTSCKFNNDSYTFKEVVDTKNKKWFLELNYKTTNQKFNYDICNAENMSFLETFKEHYCGEHPVKELGIRIIWSGDINADGLLDFVFQYNSKPENYYYRLVLSEKTTGKDPKWVETYQCYNSQE